jgi:uncharacterized membrane protein (DUF373 family)
MDKYLRNFEKFITVSLIIMMAVVILLATVELGWIIIKDIITPPIFLLDISELLDIFGLFLLILIGIELVETIKAYLSERVIRVEVVIIVALIAISRKVIILDVKELSSLTLIGIAAIILALSAGCYLLKRSLRDGRQSTKVQK